MPKGKVLTDAEKAAKETKKSDDFIRLADARVNAALDKIALIGGLANKVSYTYTPEQVAAIKKVIGDEVARTMGRFSPDGPKVAKGFSLAATVASSETSYTLRLEGKPEDVKK